MSQGIAVLCALAGADALPNLQIPGLAPGGLPGIGVPQSFSWYPQTGEKILAQLVAQPGGTQVLLASDLRQALMTLLYHAEERAVAIGLSVPIPTDKGPGLMVGAGEAKARALALASGPATDPRVLRYLEVLDSVRGVMDAAHETSPSTPLTVQMPPVQTVMAPWAVVIIVIGVAAVLAGATAWTVAEMKRLEVVEGPLARMKAAAWGLEHGIPLEQAPNVMNPPKDEGGAGWGTALLIGLGLVGLGGGVYLAKNKKLFTR